MADSERMANIRKRVAELMALGAKWDKYDAAPVNPHCRAPTLDIAEALDTLGVDTLAAYPHPDGSLDLEAELGGCRIFIEIETPHRAAKKPAAER